jgi:fructose-bisphosphate aldolase class 1
MNRMWSDVDSSSFSRALNLSCAILSKESGEESNFGGKRRHIVNRSKQKNICVYDFEIFFS